MRDVLPKRALLLGFALACSCTIDRSSASLQARPPVGEPPSHHIASSAARPTVHASIVGIDADHRAPSVDVEIEISPEFGPVLGLGEPPDDWELLVDGVPRGRADESRLSLPIEPHLGHCVLVRFNVDLPVDWRVLSLRGNLSVRVATNPVRVDIPWADSSKEVVTGKIDSGHWKVGALQAAPAAGWRLLEYTWFGADGMVKELGVLDGSGHSIPSKQVCRSQGGIGGRVSEDGWLWIKGNTPVTSLRFTRFRGVEELDVTLVAETSRADARPP